jgi:hypothetical protein
MSVVHALQFGIVGGIVLFFVFQRLGWIDRWFDHWSR